MEPRSGAVLVLNQTGSRESLEFTDQQVLFIDNLYGHDVMLRTNVLEPYGK